MTDVMERVIIYFYFRPIIFSTHQVDLSRRQVCCYCGGVFCSSCVSNIYSLPDVFPPGVIVSKPPICDECAGFIQGRKYTMSVYSPGRKRPIVVEALSQKDMVTWMHAFRAAKNLAASGGGVPLHLEGYLYKLHPSSKRFRKRYFVLHVNKLWYFKSHIHDQLVITKAVSYARLEEADRMMQATRPKTPLPTSNSGVVLKSKTDGVNLDFQVRFSLKKGTSNIHLAFSDAADMTMLDQMLAEVSVSHDTCNSPVSAAPGQKGVVRLRRKMFSVALVCNDSQILPVNLDYLTETHGGTIIRVATTATTGGNSWHLSQYDNVAAAVRAVLEFKKSLAITSRTITVYDEESGMFKEVADDVLPPYGLALCCFDADAGTVAPIGGRLRAGSSSVNASHDPESTSASSYGNKDTEIDDDDSEEEDETKEKDKKTRDKGSVMGSARPQLVLHSLSAIFILLFSPLGVCV
jgi:hypothetical protein